MEPRALSSLAAHGPPDRSWCGPTSGEVLARHLVRERGRVKGGEAGPEDPEPKAEPLRRVRSEPPVVTRISGWARRGIVDTVSGSESEDAAWERRIRWMLLYAILPIVVLPFLWAIDVLSFPVALAGAVACWLAMVAWGARKFAAESRVSFWEALVRMWRMSRG